MVADAFNPSPEEEESGRSLRVPGQPGLHSETLSQINKHKYRTSITPIDAVCFLRLIYFYVHWYFACMYVCVRLLEPLELELQTFVSYHVGAGN